MKARAGPSSKLTKNDFRLFRILLEMTEAFLTNLGRDGAVVIALVGAVILTIILMWICDS
jgi:hypothetical protein